MSQSLLHVALVVRDYDEALEYFVTKLRFSVVEDTAVPPENLADFIAEFRSCLDRHGLV